MIYLWTMKLINYLFKDLLHVSFDDVLQSPLLFFRHTDKIWRAPASSRAKQQRRQRPPPSNPAALHHSLRRFFLCHTHLAALHRPRPHFPPHHIKLHCWSSVHSGEVLTMILQLGGVMASTRGWALPISMMCPFPGVPAQQKKMMIWASIPRHIVSGTHIDLLSSMERR